VDGTESELDKAAAMKVVLTNGRVDYVIYATNPECTYAVMDGEKEVFTFRGFVGVASYEGGQLTYAYGNEATDLTDSELGSVIEDAQARITGDILDFTEGLCLDGYTVTVSMDQPVAEEELVDRYIYINNDGQENGVYRIYGAEISGNIAVLDLGMQTMTRTYVDETNLDAGFIHNVAVGQSYSIPLPAVFDVSSLFTFTEDQVVRAGNKMALTTGVAGSGMTYAADGLVTGMKFDAKNGALTWTTSKTNVGRYPIVIKAIDASGDVVGTMRFTVYVTAYTASTYAPDKCSHSKVDTYVVDNVTETVCPACGTITKTAASEEEIAAKFDIAGANMTLGNELKLNVLVKASDLGEGTYTAKITHNGETTDVVLTRYSSAYFAAAYTVSAKQMADTITVEIYDENGNAVSNAYETSVRTYAMNLLTNKAMTGKIKTLVVDMLNYGAEAQTYFKYNEADLANALLTDEQKALATDSVTCTNRQVKGQNFYGASLSLEDSIVLNMFFKNVKDGYTAKIIFTSYDGSVKTIEKQLIPYSGSIYKIEVDDVVLADAFSTVTATIYDANGNVVGSGTDSVESYIARTGNNALNEAIMKFATSAKAYLS